MHIIYVVNHTLECGGNASHNCSGNKNHDKVHEVSAEPIGRFVDTHQVHLQTDLELLVDYYSLA